MMNINEVQKRIKQRPPFQMIEKVLEVEDGEYAKGIKCVSVNEPYFAGHFPELKDAAIWRESGINILNREIKKQVYNDGGQYELYMILNSMLPPKNING